MVVQHHGTYGLKVPPTGFLQEKVAIIEDPALSLRDRHSANCRLMYVYSETRSIEVCYAHTW